VEQEGEADTWFKPGWKALLVHKNGPFTSLCPRCTFPEADGGYCPACGWTTPIVYTNALVTVPKDGAVIPDMDEFFRDSLGGLIYTANDDYAVSKADIGWAILATADEATLNTVLKVRKSTRKYEKEV
jgi:hypothetical protein